MQVQAVGNSQRLRRKIGLMLPDLGWAGERLMTHPRLDELWVDYVFALHSIIRASVPLMETARGLALQRPDEQVCVQTAAYLEQHIKEERHHDDWLLEDLEVLGVDVPLFLARPPAPSVAAMVGAQYYWMHHYHPVTLLGYIAILEGYPPALDHVDRLAAATGFPREAFRTIHKHAHLDPFHRDNLNAALDELPLTPELDALIGVSALYTIGQFVAVMAELLARYDGAVPQAA
jgi:hypothetical protein